MTREIEVQPAWVGHAELIAALMARCVPEAWSPDSVAGILALPNARAWLACVDDAPVGYALAQRAGDDVELQSIGVLPGRRGRGAGRALHDAVRAFGRDARRIVLEVAADNRNGQAFYRTLGYREAGRRRRYYRRADGAVDALIMELALAGPRREQASDG